MPRLIVPERQSFTALADHIYTADHARLAGPHHMIVCMGSQVTAAHKMPGTSSQYQPRTAAEKIHREGGTLLMATQLMSA
jgi:hypothetical protein